MVADNSCGYRNSVLAEALRMAQPQRVSDIPFGAIVWLDYGQTDVGTEYGSRFYISLTSA
jgi:hypothetical protein